MSIDSYLDLYRTLAREIRDEVPNQTMHKILMLAKIQYVLGTEADKKDRDDKRIIKEAKSAIDYHFDTNYHPTI